MLKNDIINEAIDIAANELKIRKPRYRFIQSGDISNEHVSAVFKHTKYEININTSWIEASSNVEIMITCFHEVRHAYQWYSIINNKNEDKGLLLNWKNNFDNYIKPSNTLNELNDKDYLSQPIEVDAIAWTHHFTKKTMGLNTIIPAIVEVSVHSRINEIKKGSTKPSVR